MPSPYHNPQSIAPILESGLNQREKYLSQPKGFGAAALPALGQLADAGFAASKRMNVLQAQEVYSNYLRKVDAGAATEEDHQYGRMAAMSLGLAQPDVLGKDLQRSQIDENKSTARLKNATADLYSRGGAIPGQNGPVIIEKDGVKFQEVTDPKTGGKKWSPLPQAPEDKPIPAETAKTANLAQAGIRAISQIRSIVNNPATKGKIFSPSNLAGGFGGDTLAKISGDTDTQVLSQQIAEAGDAIARLRTGAAISVTEEARYGGLLKGRFKTAAAYENALNTVEKFLQSVENDLKIGRRKMGTGNTSAVTPKAAVSEPTPSGVTADNPLGI